MSTRLLRDRPASSAAMLAIFDDRALLAAGLRFEAALAAAEAAEGLIPRDAARRIEAACASLSPDLAALAEAAAHAGTLAIPLVAALRDHLKPDEEAARLVHKGATSQDLADTALMLQAKAAMSLLLRDAGAAADGLAARARDHAATPITGRTLLQAALPVTFGLKVVQWMRGLDDALLRLRHENHALALQFGGPAGTRNGLAGRGAAVASRMAASLGLADPVLPWHARRDGIAGLAAALAILTGAFGKIARDVSLLSQTEVLEAFEPRIAGRGGSSAMAHKRNPTGCQVALSASLRAPGLAATIIAGMAQEHERGLGGWQAEAPVLADLFLLAHGAAMAMRPVCEALEVDVVRMAANLDAAAIGEDHGEAATLVEAALAARPDSTAGAEA